jgi:hypothetical protein
VAPSSFPPKKYSDVNVHENFALSRCVDWVLPYLQRLVPMPTQDFCAVFYYSQKSQNLRHELVASLSLRYDDPKYPCCSYYESFVVLALRIRTANRTTSNFSSQISLQERVSNEFAVSRDKSCNASTRKIHTCRPAISLQESVSNGFAVSRD